MDERARSRVDEALGDAVARVALRTLDALAAERVRTVQDHELDAGVRGRLQGEDHRAHVRVEAHAAILQVEDEGVEPLQVLRCRLRLLAVEADDGDAGDGVDGVADLLPRRRLALRAVFGREELLHVDAGHAQDVDGATPVGGDGRRVRDQPDLLALERPALLGLDLLQADLDRAARTRPSASAWRWPCRPRPRAAPRVPGCLRRSSRT